MVKRVILWGVAGTLALSLAACAAGTDEQPAAASESDAARITIADDGGAMPQGGEEPSLPAATRLIIGTLALETTDVAVDATQAAELLPLWESYASLLPQSASDDADAILSDIESAMSDAQLAEIEAMELSMADMDNIAAEYGIEMDGGQRGPGGGGIQDGEGGPAEGGTGGARGGRPGGEGAGEGAPPGEAGARGEDGPLEEGGAQGPSMAAGEGRGGPGGRGGVMMGSDAYIDALLQLLESKTQS